MPIPLTGLTTTSCVLEFSCPHALRLCHGAEPHPEQLRLTHYGRMKQVHDSKTSDVENRGSSHLKAFGWFTRSYTTSWGWSSKGDSHFFLIGTAQMTSVRELQDTHDLYDVLCIPASYLA
jgi:hypothetical protein